MLYIICEPIFLSFFEQEFELLNSCHGACIVDWIAVRVRLVKVNLYFLYIKLLSFSQTPSQGMRIRIYSLLSYFGTI